KLSRGPISSSITRIWGRSVAAVIMRQGEVKLGACRGRGGGGKKRKGKSLSSTRRNDMQEIGGRQGRFLNKVRGFENKRSVGGEKYIMTGLKKASKIPCDSFVPDKTAHPLTAGLLNIAAVYTRIVFATRSRALRREKQ